MKFQSLISDEEIRVYLEEAGYDVEKLKAEGVAFVNDLISKNWRFVNLQEIHDAAVKINELSVRRGWNRHQLTTAIEKISAALSSSGAQPSLAFRNLDELTDADLATILQELEYKARNNGITLDLDL